MTERENKGDIHRGHIMERSSINNLTGVCAAIIQSRPSYFVSWWSLWNLSSHWQTNMLLMFLVVYWCPKEQVELQVDVVMLAL